MTRTIFVSRHRMTECPACHAHVRVAEDVKQTSCPFCESPVTAPERDVFSLLRDIGTSTTGGIVAAALLGLGLVHCGDAPVTQLGADVGIVSTHADATPISRADSGARVVDASEPVPQPEYGAPPMPDATTADASEPVPVPLYGIAPQPDAAVADAQDPPPAPDYGIPPMPADASVNDANDPPPVALYGIAPMPTDDAGSGAAIPALNPKGEILS